MTEAGDKGGAQRHGEDRGLLASEDRTDYFEHDDLVVYPGETDSGAGDDGPKTPRTPGRVRFDLTPEVVADRFQMATRNEHTAIRSMSRRAQDETARRITGRLF
jgi:hypothetical protein